ncbi:hypothetical protein BDZ89DRAFT_553183 [Hymenopellis radicata]|nr:hypothetical protein BDZ89DRAFT_553183 [Hymenopellis radicata]
MCLTMAKAFGPNKGVSARPAMMADYYEKCTKVFLVARCGLWTVLRYRHVHARIREGGGQFGWSGACVRFGGLCQHQFGVEPGESGGKGKPARLTALLGLSKPPTRASLLKDAKAADVLPLSPPTVQKLYDVLEVQFEPLTLCADVAPLLAELESEEVYKDYVPLLREEPAPESDKDAEKLDALFKAVNAERHALALRRALVARRRELNLELSVRKEKEESSRLAEIARRKKGGARRRWPALGRSRESRKSARTSSA